MGKIIETIKETSKTWITKFGSVLLTVGIAILAAFTLGRINDGIVKHDTKKKEKLKDNIGDAKGTVNEIKEEAKEAITEAKEIKKSVKADAKKAKSENNDYVSKQTKIAKKAGFVKK